MCLLKTVIANVLAGKTTVEGHCLFDEGTQCSLLHRNLLTSYSSSQLVMKISLCLPLVSKYQPPRALVSLSIQTLNKGHIPVPVLIVPKLAALICNSVHAHLNQLPYLQGLPLTYPVTNDENFCISILIGANFYWQFIQD